MSNILNQYFFYQEKYTKLYNSSLIATFMRIGDFYECYNTIVRGPDMNRIADVTHLTKTKKDKRKEKVDDSNPYMMGFHYTTLQKFLKLLVDGGFTVVIVDQLTPPPNVKRGVTGIYSSGTFINDTCNTDSNNIVCMYMEDVKQMNNTYLNCIGLSSVDLSTGESLVYEIFANANDDKYALDETYRFILSMNPKEILICRKEMPEVSLSKKQLLTYLELEDKNVHYSTEINKSFIRPSFQNEFFGKIYKNCGMLSPIEFIDMEKMMYARLSLIILFDFAYKHNSAFINNLDKPKIFTNSKHLILGNNAIYQLNILENNVIDSANAKFKSVFDVINHTSTAMGKRFLKNSICNPLNDGDEIQLRYNCADEMSNKIVNEKQLYLNIEEYLESILDIERLSRKIFLGSIHPYEFANLLESLNDIINVYKLVEKTKYCINYKPKNNAIEQLQQFIKHSNEIFNITELKKYRLDDIAGNFYNKGIYVQIDEICQKMSDGLQTMDIICNKLAEYVRDSDTIEKKTFTPISLKYNKKDGYTFTLSKKNADLIQEIWKNDCLNKISINENTEIEVSNFIFTDIINKNGKVTQNGLNILNLDANTNQKTFEEIKNVLTQYIESPKLINLKKTDRDGYFLELTKKRSDMLKNNICKMNEIKISDTITIDPKKIIFKESTPGKSGSIGNTKLFFSDLNSKSDNVVCLKEKMVAMIKKKYLDLMMKYSEEYKDMFRTLSQFIAKIDFIKSNAKTAKMYNYCKPQIILNKENGYMNVKKMRHPIIERIRTDVEYIPHDIKLGKSPNHTENDDELDGMLMYGINAAGKSSLMKSVGLNLIMAQCGMYVAAESYIYSPYESLFARITGNDNLFKNQSQFALEMTELRAILKRNGPKTLVIGDEVCRGTEHLSANAIVATTLIHLSKTKCSFIFATHLHEIADMKIIKELPNVKPFHLSVEYDKITDSLVFDRKLKPGPGSSVYGLTIAKYIIKDDDFIGMAHNIMNDMTGTQNELLTNKTSKYCSHVYVDSCQVCGKQNTNLDEHVGMLDVHHINFQSNCNEDGFVIGKSYLPMNNKCNLIVLCKNCHHKAHHNQLVIKGYKDTSNGRVPDYEFVESTNKQITTKTNMNRKKVVNKNIKNTKNVRNTKNVVVKSA